MEKKRIIERAKKLKTKEDLLGLLSQMKKTELGDRAFPFQLKQLTWYSNPNHTRRRYRQFDIPKKTGGVRHIVAPARGLMSLLTYVNELLQAIYTPMECAVGFVPGRNVVSGAKMHINHRFVYNIDLKDFFPSVIQPRLYKRLTVPPFNFTEEVAKTIAGLCCMKVEENGQVRYVLPQGSPASPTITNCICEKMDRRLTGLAKRFNLTYTRYADDMTFSGNDYVFSKNGPFLKELHRIIEDQDFCINDKKTRLQKKGERQEVTGIIVSDRVNVPRKYVSEIRNILYIWEKYGYNDAHNKFYPKYKREKGHVKKGDPTMERVLEGKLLYMKMVKGPSHPTYLKLKEQFDRLTGALPQIEQSVIVNERDLPKVVAANDEGGNIQPVEAVTGNDERLDFILDKLCSSDFDLNVLEKDGTEQGTT